MEEGQDGSSVIWVWQGAGKIVQDHPMDLSNYCTIDNSNGIMKDLEVALHTTGRVTGTRPRPCCHGSHDRFARTHGQQLVKRLARL